MGFGVACSRARRNPWYNAAKVLRIGRCDGDEREYQFYLHSVESRVRTRALRLIEANRSMVPWSKYLRMETSTSSGIPVIGMGSISSSRSNVSVLGKLWTILDITLFGTVLGSHVSSEMCKPKRRSTIVVCGESLARKPTRFDTGD